MRINRTVAGAARLALATVMLVMLALPARADLRLDITRGKIEPLPIAIPALAGGGGEEAQTGRDLGQVISTDLERSGLFRPLDPRSFIQNDRRGRLAPVRRLAPDQRPGAGHRLGADPGRRPVPGRVPAVGRLCRAADRRFRLHHDPAELAPHRAYHRRRGLQADHRRRRLFRYPHRLYRRIRLGAAAHQASRHHGPGWRQQSVPDRWQGIGADAALFALGAGDRLSLLRDPNAERLSV